MTETGLLIAQVAFLVLLYLFIWSVVRSSRRDLEQTTPVVAGPAMSDGVPAVSGAAAAAAAASVATAEPVQRERPTGPSLDLTQNIHPRLIVERSPSLAVDAEYPLEAGLTIGRGRSNGIALSDQFVSFMHARIFPDGQFFFIEDLGSTNGTFVNGRKIDGPTQLKVRDEVVFGDTTLRYEE
ncbi:MAG TPA: FHA domain-containing protein [Miltoncostaeales bacterium]|nr:FHA domain-containing protein [Miltoncostaeales bacterium]